MFFYGYAVFDKNMKHTLNNYINIVFPSIVATSLNI